MKRKNIVLMMLLVCFILCSCGNNSENNSNITREILTNLENFTELFIEDDKYTFFYDDFGINESMQAWELICISNNIFLKFYDWALYEDINILFGDGAIIYASYVLPDNRISIYMEPDITDGISIVSYFVDDKEYEVMLDGDKYEASDELIAIFEDYQIIERIMEHYETVKSLMAENNINIDDLEDLRYKDFEEVME